MVRTGKVDHVGGGSDRSAAVGKNLVPKAHAPSNSSTASAVENTRDLQNSLHSTVSPRSSKLSVGAQVSDTKGSLLSGSTELRYPSSPIRNSFESNEPADIHYQADDSSSSCDEDMEDFDEQTPKNKKPVNTPSTMDVEQSSTGLSFDESTPRNDAPIPLNLSSAPRPMSPDLESESSSLSSVPSTPSKAPADRRRSAPPKPKLTTLQEASREVHLVAAEIKEARAEYRRARGLFEHLTREENVTPEILDAAVDAANRRLVHAVEDNDGIQSGNPPRHIPYPPETISELLAAVEKAEMDRENWYAETRRLFWLFEGIERERVPALKHKMEAARKKEAAAREKEDDQAATARQQSIAALGTPPDKENSSDPSPATIRRVLPDETPTASPATSDASKQATIVRGIRNAMRRATYAADAPQTPTKKSRR